MIQLSEGGAYLVNGTEIIPDGRQAQAEIKSKTGKEISREEAAKQTIAYGILNEHNTSGNMEKLKIKYFTDQITHLEYIEGKSDWIDLRVSEDIELKQGEFKLVPLGIAVKLPEGYEAHIVPRSSTYKNFGIIQANSCGIIDSSYCGDNDMWKMPVIAMRDTKIHINDRICQFRIFKNQPRLVFEETEHLEGTDRGGFGSTGII